MKLSGAQIVWIIATTQIVAMIGLQISPAIQIAKQDAWLSMLVGGVIGLAITFLVVHLSLLHPKQTLAQFSQALLGRWLGRIIVLPYLIVWYLLPASLLRSFGDFVHLILLDRTPIWVIMMLLTGLMAYLTYSAGIQGIARFCELAGPAIIITLIASFFLNAGNLHWHHILPVYVDSGWVNILKGSIAPAFWFAGPFTLMVILSFMQNPRKAISKTMLGVGVAVIIVFTATLMVLLVFGPNFSAKIRFSYFVFVRSINILNFIQNADIFVMFVFIFAVFAQLSLYLFIASYETAYWFHVKDWRKLIWFGIPAIFIMAILIPDESVITLFRNFYIIAIFPVCGIGIPLLLWIISAVKKKSVKL